MLLPDRSRHIHPLYWLMTALIALAGLAASAYVYVQVDRSSRQVIVDRALTLAEAIRPSEVQQLAGSAADLTSPEYQELKSLMVREQRVNDGIRFIYLIGTKPDGTLFFYGDSEDPSSADYSPPGQEYPEATPAMHAFFKNGGMPLSEGPDRDRWGLWISAYAPVHDASGKLVAMLGMDVPAESYLVNLIAEASLPLLLALLILILLVVDRIRHTRREMLLAQKAEFLSIASHQIRTPLIGIRWAVEQILNSNATTLDPRDRDVLELTHESSLGLIARVNNLLDVTALEQNAAPARTNQSTLVRPFLEDIAASLELSAKRKHVHMVIDDSVAGDLSVPGNRENMQHIFFNLLGNAVKYTREGTQVTVSYEWVPAGHQFSISDHGIGIAPEDQELIFAGYHRTQQAMESGESGSGLGLYLTKRLITLLKGTIEIRSTVGEGSTFVVTLPE